jgi:hypothetical protein
MLEGISWNATWLPLIQLGDAGGIENTGYTSSVAGVSTAVAVYAAYTAGFGFATGAGLGAADAMEATIILNRMNNSNKWRITGTSHASVGFGFFMSGTKVLSQELDRIRYTTTGGTATADGGTMNISWEF